MMVKREAGRPSIRRGAVVRARQRDRGGSRGSELAIASDAFEASSSFCVAGGASAENGAAEVGVWIVWV